jgi:rubrerythrin
MRDYSKKEWKRIFEDSIADEYSDAAYYNAMAKIAPDYEARDIILAIAADEERHAKELTAAYESLFGCRYKKPSLADPIVRKYKQALEKAFNEEMNAYRKYKEYYLCSGNQRLRDLWFDLMHDENRHASYMLYLMNKYCCGMMDDGKKKPQEDHKYPGCGEPDYGCGPGYSQYGAGTVNYSFPE